MLDLRLDDDRGKSKAGGAAEPRRVRTRGRPMPARPSASAATSASNSSRRVLPGPRRPDRAEKDMSERSASGDETLDWASVAECTPTGFILRGHPRTGGDPC